MDQTVVFVAVDGRLAGLLGIADPVKPEAAQAIRDLRNEGLRVVMLTGDSQTTAEAVARTARHHRLSKPECCPATRPTP